MKPNFKGDKRRKEELRKKKQEEKREKRLGKKTADSSSISSDVNLSVEAVNRESPQNE